MTKRSSISCPKCNSLKIQVYDKEVYRSWVGDLKVFKHERGESRKYKECKCLNCGHVFPWLEPDILKAISEMPTETRLGARAKAITKSGQIMEGKIIDDSATLKIDCGRFVGIFEGQMITDIVLQPEETPAFLLGEDNLPMGLLWAGSQKVSIAVKLTGRLAS